MVKLSIRPLFLLPSHLVDNSTVSKFHFYSNLGLCVLPWLIDSSTVDKFHFDLFLLPPRLIDSSTVNKSHFRFQPQVLCLTAAYRQLNC